MINYLELRNKFASLGYRIEMVNALVSMAVTLDKYELSDQEKETIFELISHTGRDRIRDLPDKVLDGKWEPFNYGNVQKGDFVRVKLDAYDSESGAEHNGLVGTLVHMAGHRCSVEYLGEATGKSIKHSMDSLESLTIG